MYLKVVLTLLLVVAVLIAVQLSLQGNGAASAEQTTGPASPHATLWVTRHDPVLDRVIPHLDLKGATFAESLDAIRDAAGVSIAVRSGVMGVVGKPRVNLRADRVAVSAALAGILEQVGGLEYTVREGVIFVSWQTAQPPVTRFHDARDLIESAACSAGEPVVVEADGRASPGVRDRSAAGLVRVIRQSVAPGTWNDAGLSVGSILEWNGILVVTHTPERQREVARLLDDLRRGPGGDSTSGSDADCH